MDAFRDALDVCGLTDVGYTGNDWTFERKVAGGTFTHVRLDRCVANSDWMLSYPAATHEHKTTATSDHAALLLKMDVHAGTAGPRSFKYELMWERDPRLFDCVSNGMDGVRQLQIQCMLCMESCQGWQTICPHGIARSLEVCGRK